MTFEMENPGGSESDVKMGSELGGDKTAVWLLCQLLFRACPLQRFQAKKNHAHPYLMLFLLAMCSYLKASNFSTILIKGIENDEEKLPIKLHFSRKYCTS